MPTKVMILIGDIANGGAERVATLWAGFLADAGYEVTLATFAPQEHEYPVSPKVNYVCLQPQKVKPNPNKPPHPFKKRWRRWWRKIGKFFTCVFNPQSYCQYYCRDYARVLQRYLNEHPQDVLIPFLTRQNLLATTVAPHQVKVATQTIRNSPWHGSKIKRLAYWWAIRHVGSVILQNDEQLDYFRKRAFRHVQKFIVHNPLNPAIQNLQKDTYRPIQRMVAIGRLHAQKNHTMMIKAVRILRDRYHYLCTLDIYGDGAEKKRLHNLIKKYHLQKQVFLRGRIDDIFTTEIDYDLFLMTSHFEGTPNALLEAMGLGLPCLVTNFRTGARELINDGTNGFILPSYRPGRLAQKILQINDPALLERVGRQARTDMQRYTPAHCVAELTTCINDLLK